MAGLLQIWFDLLPDLTYLLFTVVFSFNLTLYVFWSWNRADQYLRSSQSNTHLLSDICLTFLPTYKIPPCLLRATVSPNCCFVCFSQTLKAITEAGQPSSQPWSLYTQALLRPSGPCKDIPVFISADRSVCEVIISFQSLKRSESARRKSGTQQGVAYSEISACLVGSGGVRSEIFCLIIKQA
jgi:hypothetical protein